MMTLRLKGFDGIRGLAVLSVIITHTGIWGYLKRHDLVSPDLIVLVHGGTGVQAFFVLSGFLITMLLMHEFKKNGKVSLYNFYVRRSLRIIPLYCLCLFLVLLLHLFGESATNWKSLLYAVTYTYNFIGKDDYSRVLGHTWSLAVEEHFYLVWPLVFSVFYAAKKGLLKANLVLFSLSSIIALNVLMYVFDLGDQYFLTRWSFIAGNGIALGCLGALLLCGGNYQYWQNIMGNKRIILSVVIVLYFNSLILPGNPYFIGWYLRAISIALFIGYVYVHQEGIIARMLENAALKYIGLISYGLYMYQGIFMGTGPGRLPGQTWPPSTLTGLLLLVIVAPLSFHFFEKPVLKLKNKYQNK